MDRSWSTVGLISFLCSIHPVLAGTYYYFSSWWVIAIVVFIVIAISSCIGACIRYKRMQSASSQHGRTVVLNTAQYSAGVASGAYPVTNMAPYGQPAQFMGQSQQPPPYIPQSGEVKDPNAPPSYNEVVANGADGPQPPTWNPYPQSATNDSTAPYPPPAGATAPYPPANPAPDATQPAPYPTQPAPYPTQ